MAGCGFVGIPTCELPPSIQYQKSRYSEVFCEEMIVGGVSGVSASEQAEEFVHFFLVTCQAAYFCLFYYLEERARKREAGEGAAVYSANRNELVF